MGRVNSGVTRYWDWDSRDCADWRLANGRRGGGRGEGGTTMVMMWRSIREAGQRPDGYGGA
eukprot:scaffold5320_cov138-Isochrysis_galbana.AAC.4